MGILTALFSNIMSFVILLPVRLIAIIGHELGHAYVSDKLGDPTPRNTGRLTINPLAHLDLYGTLLMLLTGFGWAKPVMINPMYYRDRKKGTALVSLAGPFANLVMAFCGMIIWAIAIILKAKTGLGATVFNVIGSIAHTFIYTNLCFMVFNLIPIPPLDGSKVLGIFLPDRTYYKMLQYERYSMILIMILSLTGMFNTIIGTGVNAVFNLIAVPINGLLKMII